MKFIGITGGVGAGKSAILSYISEHFQAKVVLADDLAKSLMEPGQICYPKLQQLFTSYDVFEQTGEIDKQKMAKLLFSHPDLRLQMNAIVHPAVKAAVMEMVEEERSKGELKYFFFEAALLIEDHYDELCDEMWYIYTNETNRRARLKASRGYSDEKIDAMFASQMPEEAFRKHCQQVIDNNGTPEEAFAAIDEILREA